MTVSCAAVTELWSRGYSALPYPREVRLTGGDLVVDGSWKIAPGAEPDPGALGALRAGLAGLLDKAPATAKSAGKKCVALRVKAGTVAAGTPEGIAAQGYRLEMAPDGVTITGNSGAGLFYGVGTLLQLLRRTPCGRGLQLPAGTIEDWPDRELRIIHYDTKHHQDRLEAVKDMISRAAAFKINGIAWEIEDKFAYPRHPSVGAPGAFTPDQMREITAHALERHVEIIPILQGPSHLAFLLKHEEYAHLREDPANNYMLCPSNEECYELLFAMYDELLEATPGCRYFHVGTDEPYFLGDGIDCGCRARREEIGQSGMMAEFIARCARYLMDKGRQVMCWGEWPLTPPDVHRIPAGVINAVWQNPALSEAYREHGQRELIYCPTQGARPLFPEYFYPPEGGRKPQVRVELLWDRVSRGPCRPYDPLGVIIAAWDDSGLHLETFWMGWALGCGWGWNPGAPGREEAVAAFCKIFHGPEAIRMPAVYRSLDRLARFWTNGWDQAPSKRGPSYKRQWHPRFDRTIAMPRIPDPENLDNQPFFRERYTSLLAEAAGMKEVLGRVTDMLAENLGRTDTNRHSLEAFLTIAALVGDFISMLETLAGIEETLDAARRDVGNVHYEAARAKLAEVSAAARAYVADREAGFRELTATWEKSRYPKGQSVDGRDFLHIQDTTKNHNADWTVDLGYLIKPSRDLDIEGWADRLDAAAAEFSRLHPDAGQKWKPGWGFEEDG